MQFKKLRDACDNQGQRVQANNLPPGHSDHYYCLDCHSRLVLHVTHTEGRYFEHDLERTDPTQAKDCRYRLTQSPPRSSPCVRQAFAPALGNPTPRSYFCVLCDKAYLGSKTCPNCKEHHYTTEVELRDLRGVLPEK